MQLHQIVRINESGIVANAVNFGMMADADKNLKLCQGFIFNYNHGHPKSSTLGVLDAIQKSYQSVNQANIHLFVQDYGKGKSHFALVAANYFKQLLDSPEVEGILDQIKIASEHNQGIVQDLKTYKRRNPKHLVICINGGSSELDLRKIFLRALSQTLETEGITDSLAQQICQKPLEYLTKLTDTQKEKANQYLENNDYQRDLDSIIDSLNQDDYRVVSTVKSISSELNDGFPIDFETDLSVDRILEELITELCSGADAKYSGILILFDELNNYLQAWSTDPYNSGGLTLQNITDACENYKSKIALVCFTQIRPLKSVPNQSAEDYKKLASRLEISESTYEPVSSLELVIKGLLDQQVNPNLWNQFCQTWDNTLFADSRKAHQTIINIDRERDWKLEDFQTNLTRRGCFPLHPLNSYLLCNLDFTQGRTVIQYIKENVKKFINSQPVEKNGKLNYIPAISLVDAFEQLEFSRHYSEYQKAYDTIRSSATEAEKAVLKGLFLFYVSQNKLKKSESEKHDVILSELTGLSEKETKETLDILSQKKQVIYFNKGDNTYRFYSGSNLREIEQEIEEEVSKKLNEISVNLVVNHCQEKVETYFPSEKVEGIDFINKNKLLNDEWFFEYKFYNIPDLKRVLNSHQVVENLKAKGIFAYVLAETLEELQGLRHQINDLLSQAKNKKQIAVAIPNNKPIRDICKDLLAIDIITRKGRSEKEESGTAYEQYKKQLQEKIKREVKAIIGSSTYYFLESDQFTTVQKQNPENVVSHLLKQLYRFVPPLAKNDKMALNSSTGNTIIGYTAKRLLEDELNPTKFPNQSYHTLVNQVFVNSWQLFTNTSQKYSVQIPTNENVREAWDKIDQLTALEDKKNTSININKIWQELSNSPFGYNEYTFTMLLTAWIVYHRSEVMLEGSSGIPKNSKEQVLIQKKPLKDWATTNVFDKPKDFVNKWILAPGKTPRLIRSQTVACPEIPATIDYHKAEKLIKDIDQFINSADPDQAKVQEITPKRKQLLAEIKKINDWFKPVEEAENLLDDVNLETLLKLYPSLQQQPKNINLASPLKSDSIDSIVVNRTSQQKQRQADALQKVQDKIGETVIQLTDKSESLKTQQEYGRYQGELETAIEKITQVSYLPPRLIKTLNYSLDVATRKLDEIQHQTEIKDCLEKINLRYNSLSTNASQEDYIKALSEIANLTNNLEIVKQESQYQTIIQDIESKQADLETTLEIWSERLTGITKNEALKLSQEVSEQKNRFTQIESAQKVKEILEQLNPIILEISNEEETQARKQQQDSEIMQQLRQNNPKFLNTINLCQQGIEKITNLRSQLNYPERFNTEIEQLINALNNQVLDFQQQFENLKEQVDKIETDQQLSQLQTDLAKLDLIFKDSDDYSEYQQLLEVLKTKSIDRKNESQEEKIIDLFIQLPPERQQILYSKLGQHLSHNEQINE
ncbi:hypothetical protein L2E65_00975 [Planktothrix agardhii 1801]|uniref:hypothetical protein n=1 Tax=Planktothrix agardhii TaxID=1160 RepID=UPI001F3E518C|nr:hypothetical protein [Planktothrix agardhii]MCF3623373.1 hypothetical protein [Planktothrix agardhii 1801]